MYYMEDQLVMCSLCLLPKHGIYIICRLILEKATRTEIIIILGFLLQQTGRSVVFSGFLHWPPWYSWNIVECCAEHHNLIANPQAWYMYITCHELLIFFSVSIGVIVAVCIVGFLIALIAILLCFHDSCTKHQRSVKPERISVIGIGHHAIPPSRHMPSKYVRVSYGPSYRCYM